MCRCNEERERRSERRPERSEREEVLERALRELTECDHRAEDRSRRCRGSRSCCR